MLAGWVGRVESSTSPVLGLTCRSKKRNALRCRSSSTASSVWLVRSMLRPPDAAARDGDVTLADMACASSRQYRARLHLRQPAGAQRQQRATAAEGVTPDMRKLAAGGVEIAGERGGHGRVPCCGILPG